MLIRLVAARDEAVAEMPGIGWEDRRWTGGGSGASDWPGRVVVRGGQQALAI